MDIPYALANLWMVAAYLMALSYLVRGNPFFTAVQQLVIGILAAQHFLISISSLESALFPWSSGSAVKLIYLAFSCLLFTSLTTRWRWLSRYPTAILAGTGLGLVLRNIMYTEVLNQIRSTIVPLTGVLIDDLSNVFFVVSLCLTLFYFMFGFKLRGALVKVNRAARFLIIVGLGASNGAAYWSRSTLNYGGFLQIRTWLELFWENIH